jgi:signal transduction histidine kinase/CheY-like chemotaxis protein/HAMP domain-containing protein
VHLAPPLCNFAALTLIEYGVDLTTTMHVQGSDASVLFPQAIAPAPPLEAVAILSALAALKRGDFTVRLPVEWTGMAGKIADTFNEVVLINERLSKELSHVSKVVGKEGKLDQRASIGELTGSWATSLSCVNELILDLAQPTKETARVIGAVARGDLTPEMSLEVEGRPLEGEFFNTAKVVNKMVQQLGSFAAEVTRVAREVGTEGKLGGQARVEGVSGTWKDLTDSVNSMAGNLTDQVRNIAEVTTAVANGDLSKKIAVDVKGEFLELKNTINTMVDQLRSFASEVTRVAREVGTEGKLGGQARVEGVSGTWKDLTDSVNSMAGNLTAQVRNIADVTTAVANGDLSKKVTVDVEGEILELKNTVNTMVDQLSSFASEVTRVAREVGTEGSLGGQAEVKGVAGTWKDLTDSVNSMAGNLTAQVRNIAHVTKAVANGDLSKKVTVDVKGEILELKNTVNTMVDTLSTFADQVTTVAREVGVEGKLGGQASVPGAAGTWKNLTDNVNQLAANLTTQVRAIAEVATAVTKGDLTRSIKVEAHGEVAILKDNINEMIRNLKETTQKNAEQDWLKTNLAKFSRMLQGQKDLLTVGRLILSELAPVVTAQHAVFYILDGNGLRMLASYAHEDPSSKKVVQLGQGLIGQCAVEKQKILLTTPFGYVRISSGLGSAEPRNVIVLPVVFEGAVKGVLELASFETFNSTHQAFLEQLCESIGIVINTIEANMRTENLLKQSQSLAKELQARQEELEKTNNELEEKAHLLAHQNQEVEHKNREVEQARQALEEKAKQLALTSKYKSEFLANMSHELRTPLNSLLILSDQLSKNPDGNLTPKQTEFAKTIHSSGTDLLMLINDILDLSKIESGTVVVDASELRLFDLKSYVERTFRHVAEAKNLAFNVDLSPNLPKQMYTDTKRLQQVIKNLLSNAFKFTHHGSVALRLENAYSGWTPGHETLSAAPVVLALSVTDTGIGISADKQQIIFEAFQQADGSTNRKYGGTGLGLAISREIARLLGGEIKLLSAPNKGSTFTLYLPQVFSPQPRAARDTFPPHTDDIVVQATQSVDLISDDLPKQQNTAGDDRDQIQASDDVLLVIESDLSFSKELIEVAHGLGVKVLATQSGASGLALAREHQPLAVALDLRLLDIDGWRVLERMKNDALTRHIPVNVISGAAIRDPALALGAIGVLQKPAASRAALTASIRQLLEVARRRVRKLLIADGDADVRKAALSLFDPEDVKTTEATTLRGVLEAITETSYDAMLFGERLEDARIGALANALAASPNIRDVPLIICGNLAVEDEIALRSLSHATVVRRAATLDRAIEPLVTALHIAPEKLPQRTRATLQALSDLDRVLLGKRVLIVDDDIRNIFALASVLERHNMAILSAETGRDAIRVLRSAPNVDVVLMDIMMPEMDGLDTIREIRKLERFRDLPIVAVTAKAMKGDREKCIEAGAWDYLSKPVDSEQMLAVLRAWLRRKSVKS